jgi:serine/threonine-protein phosphatase 4 regulatory subunit 1
VQNAEEVLYHCAFNFPAVLQTLGPKAWPELKKIHERLARDTRIKVRRTLSYSLFECAKILGAELAERELISILFHFLQDIEEVREGVMESLPEFISCLDFQQRLCYIDQFSQAWAQNDESWRKRDQKAL